MRDAELAKAKAASYRKTAVQKRQRIAELEVRAQLFGNSVKQSTQAKVLERKWLRFLLVHGNEYGFVEKRGPTVELVKHLKVRIIHNSAVSYPPKRGDFNVFEPFLTAITSASA